MTRVAGTVVEVRDGRAWIECHALPAGCPTCATGRGCGGGRRAGPARLETPAELDGRPLRAGEAVEIEADERRLLRSALGLYLPLLAGLLLGPAFLRALGWETGPWPLFAAAAGLGLGALVARRLGRRSIHLQLRRPA